MQSELHSFDPMAVCADLHGDGAELAVLLRLFLEVAPAQMQRFEAAVGLGDYAAAAAVAHQLRGAFSVLHARRAQALALALETQVQGRGDVAALAECCAALSASFEPLLAEVQDWLARSAG